MLRFVFHLILVFLFWAASGIALGLVLKKLTHWNALFLFGLIGFLAGLWSVIQAVRKFYSK